jgi:hypothetical protein
MTEYRAELVPASCACGGSHMWLLVVDQVTRIGLGCACHTILAEQINTIAVERQLT